MSKSDFIKDYCQQRSITEEYFKQHFICSKVQGEYTARLRSAT